MTGTILGFVKNDYIIQPTDSKPNRNIMVVGGPGSYKTQGFVITNVLNEIENSIVVTDPKGEVYEHTAEFKRRQGYDVHVINFSKMEQSDRYNPIDYVESDLDATNVATKIVDSSNKDGKKDIWYQSQRSLLSALILYIKHENPPENRNMEGIINFLQTHEDSNKKDEESELNNVFSSLDIQHPARRLYELGYKKSQGDMKGSIIVSLLTTISNYINLTVSTFTSFSDFNLQEIGRKKTMLYVIIPIMDTSWEGLTNIFFSQLFDQLYELASEQHSKLPVSVDFILDEFVNLGTFTNYEEFLATCRGYGIGVATIIQSLTQLQDKYNKEKAESILGNCSVKICMNAANNTTAKYFSELLDKATVKVATSNKSASKNSKQEGSSTSHSDNEGYSGRDLMTAGEITSMPDDTQIIVFSNLPPLKTKKAFQFDLFPQPKELLNQSDYEKNTNPKQLERLEKLTKKFNQASEKKEEEKQDRIIEKQRQDKIAKEKKEEEERKKQERNKNEALKSSFAEYGEAKEE